MKNPKCVAGSGSQTIPQEIVKKQVLIHNMDATASMNAKINDDTGSGKTIPAGEHLGVRINAGIYKVEITATGSWEVLFL